MVTVILWKVRKRVQNYTKLIKQLFDTDSKLNESAKNDWYLTVILQLIHPVVDH